MGIPLQYHYPPSLRQTLHQTLYSRVTCILSFESYSHDVVPGISQYSYALALCTLLSIDSRWHLGRVQSS